MLTPHGTELTLRDVEAAFPEFQGKADKGVTITLEHRINGKNPSDHINLVFGCRVTFDLWNKSYLVEPLNATAGAKVEAASLATFPNYCRTALMPGLARALTADLEVTSSLEPVSAEQEEKTRAWLAEHGIGSASQALLGRAVAALIDLKEDKAVKRLCRVAQKK